MRTLREAQRQSREALDAVEESTMRFEALEDRVHALEAAAAAPKLPGALKHRLRSSPQLAPTAS